MLREDVRGRSNDQMPMPDLRFRAALACASVCGLAGDREWPRRGAHWIYFFFVFVFFFFVFFAIALLRSLRLNLNSGNAYAHANR